MPARKLTDEASDCGGILPIQLRRTIAYGGLDYCSGRAHPCWPVAGKRLKVAERVSLAVGDNRMQGLGRMLARKRGPRRRFQLVLDKPPHYDHDGDALGWCPALIPSN